MSGSDDSFVSRWSRRKAQARSGETLAEPVSPPPTLVTPAALPATVGAVPLTVPEPRPAAPPLPTLEDVARLTRDADFSRFMLPGVDETVKRAAMKKLFSDPHFNIMDGLDTYIDDYGIPDPIPDEMLRRMTQSKSLRLFDEELPADEAASPAALPQASPDGAAATPLPQSYACAEPGAPAPETPLDEDTALRLQPDDAAGPASTGPDCPGPWP